jgi:hypothetical protein
MPKILGMIREKNQRLTSQAREASTAEPFIKNRVPN